MWVGHCAVIVKLANKHYVITGPIAHASPLAVSAYAVLAESIGGRSQECMGVCVAGKEVLEHAPHYSHNNQLIKSFPVFGAFCANKSWGGTWE